MWVKVDDALPDHAKVIEAGRHLGSAGPGRVLAIWLKGICYCNHNLTDGLIPSAVLKSWRLYDRRPLDVAYAMVEARIFDQEPNGYRFHDYDEYQPSKSEVDTKRKKDLERKRRRKAEQDSEQNPSRFHAESEAFPVTPSRPGLSSTHQKEDHRAARAGFPQPVENAKVLKALIWREVHAAYDDQTEVFDIPSVTERVKVVAARAHLVYGGDFFHEQIEVAIRRVPQQRRRRAA